MRQIGIRHVDGSRLGDLVLAAVGLVEALESVNPFMRVLGVVGMASRVSCRASQGTRYVLAGVAGDEKIMLKHKSRSASSLRCAMFGAREVLTTWYSANQDAGVHFSRSSSWLGMKIFKEIEGRGCGT